MFCYIGDMLGSGQWPGAVVVVVVVIIVMVVVVYSSISGGGGGISVCMFVCFDLPTRTCN